MASEDEEETLEDDLYSKIKEICSMLREVLSFEEK